MTGEWKPIATAPATGTIIIGRPFGPGRVYQKLAFYDYWEGDRWISAETSRPLNFGADEQPTHWKRA